MLKECHGNQSLNYVGTIIDIETIGDFCRGYPKNDSREYQEHKLVIFGYINRQGFHIYCAQGIEDIPELEEKASKLLETIDKERPLYAFQCHHEMSVLLYRLKSKTLFDKELQAREYEPKEEALRNLGIPNSFGDPFQNERKPGYACQIAWLNSRYDDAIQHNRACLLKEQALLLKGRGITPIPLDFKEMDSSYISPDSSQSFQPWTREQKNYVIKAWSEGKTIKSISQDCKRKPRAIWMRLQRLGKIPSDIPYTVEKESWALRDLP